MLNWNTSIIYKLINSVNRTFTIRLNPRLNKSELTIVTCTCKRNNCIRCAHSDAFSLDCPPHKSMNLVLSHPWTLEVILKEHCDEIRGWHTVDPHRQSLGLIELKIKVLSPVLLSSCQSRPDSCHLALIYCVGKTSLFQPSQIHLQIIQTTHSQYSKFLHWEI